MFKIRLERFETNSSHLQLYKERKKGGILSQLTPNNSQWFTSDLNKCYFLASTLNVVRRDSHIQVDN